MILSHLSGIRHYERDAKKVKEDKEKAKRLLKPPVKEKEEKKGSSENGKPSTDQNIKAKESSQAQKKKEFEHEEYYLKENFESVIQALDLFKNDPLIFKPGKSTYFIFLFYSDMTNFQGFSRSRRVKSMFCSTQAQLFCTPLMPSRCLVLLWSGLPASASWMS